MRVLVTGGAGFVGTNLTDHWLRHGAQVTVLDNLSRRGVDKNATWLKNQHPSVEIIEGDIRDRDTVSSVCRGFDQVYHLGAQVAVTTSVADPRTDFHVNLEGTLNVLEAVRQNCPSAVVFYTSTNKVYGGMEDLEITRQADRYTYRDLPEGISEDRPLDFHSPYGCSKGAADQYVRDYGRIYGLRTVVFRMSCIYGEHQCGNEDQGWVAHFVRAAIHGDPLNIYGDGRQVRDILYVGDLVAAFATAAARIDRTAGRIYNIGGGQANTVSLLELLHYLREISGREVPVTFADWRPGDQPVYISNTAKAAAEFGWRAEIAWTEGVSRLYAWMKDQAGG